MCQTHASAVGLPSLLPGWEIRPLTDESEFKRPGRALMWELLLCFAFWSHGIITNGDYTALLPENGQTRARGILFMKEKVYKYSTGKFMLKMCLSRKPVPFCSQWQPQWFQKGFQIFYTEKKLTGGFGTREHLKVDKLTRTMPRHISLSLRRHTWYAITNIFSGIAMQTWTFPQILTVRRQHMATISLRDTSCDSLRWGSLFFRRSEVMQAISSLMKSTACLTGHFPWSVKLGEDVSRTNSCASIGI